MSTVQTENWFVITEHGGTSRTLVNLSLIEFIRNVKVDECEMFFGSGEHN